MYIIHTVYNNITGYSNNIAISWACRRYPLPTIMFSLLGCTASYKGRWNLSHVLKLLTRMQRGCKSLNFNIRFVCH